MTFTERFARTQVVLGAFAVVIGIWAFVMARNVTFTATVAPRLGWTSLEVNLMSLNRLGALVVLVLGVVGILAGATHKLQIGWIPAIGFALLAIQVLIQWRPSGSNWFGSNGPVLAFGILLAAGFAVTAAVTHAAGLTDNDPASATSAPVVDPS